MINSLYFFTVLASRAHDATFYVGFACTQLHTLAHDTSEDCASLVHNFTRLHNTLWTPVPPSSAHQHIVLRMYTISHACTLLFGPQCLRHRHTSTSLRESDASFTLLGGGSGYTVGMSWIGGGLGKTACIAEILVARLPLFGREGGQVVFTEHSGRL